MAKLNNKFCYPRYSGFTLVEIMISLGVLAVIMLGIYSFLIESYKFQDFVSEQSAATSLARDGVEQLIYELREADISDTGSYPLVLANPQEFIFYSDIDADVLTEKVHYYLEGTTLKKGVVETTYDPIAEEPYSYTSAEQVNDIAYSVQNGTAAIFTYYNGDYPSDSENNPLAYPADPTEIKLIKINLQININPYRVPDTYLLENYVQLRNLKENL